MTVDDIMQIAKRFLERAAEELDKQPPGRDQATEKVWMAMVYAMGAVAKERGWRHDMEILYILTMHQIVAEQMEGDDAKDMIRDFVVANGMNWNYCGNFWDVQYIRLGIMCGWNVVDRLEEIIRNGPKPSSVGNDEGQNRLSALLGIKHLGQDVIDRIIPIGAESADGFKKNGRLGLAVSQARAGKDIPSWQ